MTVKSVAKAERTTRGTVMAIALIGPAQGEWPATQNPLNIKHTKKHTKEHTAYPSYCQYTFITTTKKCARVLPWPT